VRCSFVVPKCLLPWDPMEDFGRTIFQKIRSLSFWFVRQKLNAEVNRELKI